MSPPDPPAGEPDAGSDRPASVVRTAEPKSSSATRADTAVRTLVLRVPGPSWLVSRGSSAWRRLRQVRGLSGQRAARGLARLSLLPAIAVVAWLVPGLPLLIAGFFAPVPMLLIAAPLVTALAVNVMHRTPEGWPVELPGLTRERGWAGWLGAVGTLAIACVFAAWQLSKDSASVIATRTPGAAYQTGYWIAQHGSLPINGMLAAFGGAHPGMHLSSIGFFQHGSSVVPDMSAGLPILLASGFWSSGTGGAVVVPVLGGLAVLAFGGLVGRLAGWRWAPAGALALALTLPELYTSRDAFSEPAVQVLLFGGLSLVIDALTAGRRAAEAEAVRVAPADIGVSAAAAARPDDAAVFAKPQDAAVSAKPQDAAVSAKPQDAATVAKAQDAAGVPAASEPADTMPLESVTASAGTTAGTGPTTDTELLAHTGFEGETHPDGDSGASSESRSGPAPEAVAAAGSGGWDRWREPLGRARRLLKPMTSEQELAAFGGLCLGLTSLLTLGSLVYLVPAIAVAGILLVARRAAGVAFCLGVVAGCLYGIAAAYFLARPMVHSQAPILRVIGEDAGGIILLLLAVAVLRLQPRWIAFVRRLVVRRPLRWLPEIVAILAVVAIGGLALRPYLQTVHGSLGRAAVDYIAHLQQAAGLKVDPTRLYAEDSLYWVIWYAGIATLLLGVFGLALMLRRCVRALLTWRDTSGASLNWAMPLAIIIGGSAVVLWEPFTVPDQPWASRRLVPLVIPGLILLATWAAAWLSRRARDRGAGAGTAAAVGVFCVGAMVLPAVTTSFGFGVSHTGPGGGLRASAGGLAQARTGAGEDSAVQHVCAEIGNRSTSVVIVDPRIGHVFSQVIRGICGVPVASMRHGATATQVDAVITGIRKAGRRPVILGASPSQVGQFGQSPVEIMHLQTTQDSHELTQPAGAPWPASYVIWMSVASPTSTGL